MKQGDDFFSNDEWFKKLEKTKNRGRFKSFWMSGWGVALGSILLVAPFVLYQNYQDKQTSPRVGMISRKTSEELKSKHLIDTEYEDNFLESCKEHTLPKVNNDYEKMSRTCGCEYESIALIALNNNQPFADVVSDMVNGRRAIESCEFVD